MTATPQTAPVPHTHRPAAAADLAASVAVVTYERPDHVARCLTHLLAQTRAPVEIIVVDASEGEETARVVRERFPTVAYHVCPAGRGSTATGRDIAYRMTSGDVLAFVDDDAYAEPRWLERLLPFYDDPTVGGVGGRQIRRQPGELEEGKDAIGRLLADGTMTGNFAADPGHPVDVDHLLGANMSFRRSAIDRLGGIRDGYDGTCIREETDLCLQVSSAGYRLVYTPDAVVEHVAGPYAKGQRFDLRYAYWAQKNHLILLIRNFGFTAPVVRAYLISSGRQSLKESFERVDTAWSRAKDRDGRGAARSVVAAVTRAAVVLAASLSGLAGGAGLARDDRRRSARPGSSC